MQSTLSEHSQRPSHPCADGHTFHPQLDDATIESSRGGDSISSDWSLLVGGLLRPTPPPTAQQAQQASRCAPAVLSAIIRLGCDRGTCQHHERSRHMAGSPPFPLPPQQGMQQAGSGSTPRPPTRTPLPCRHPQAGCQVPARQRGRHGLQQQLLPVDAPELLLGCCHLLLPAGR